LFGESREPGHHINLPRFEIGIVFSQRESGP
jgi:hypothetical protein